VYLHRSETRSALAPLSPLPLPSASEVLA
jgi:hypothetical protein